MWLFNEIGFFSVVRKPLAGSKVNVIQVRGRTVDDLKRLKGSCKLKGRLLRSPVGADYPVRLIVSKAELYRIMLITADSITYDNFKDHIAERSKYQDGDMGLMRDQAYHRVWSILRHCLERPWVSQPIEE